ncbi:MAG: C4-dicarboxylate TRAP transporter substrate-binding protein [Gammaproteobacteria bacterium]
MEKKTMIPNVLRSPQALLKGMGTVLLASGLLAGFAHAAEYELRLAHVTSDKEPIQQAMLSFAEKVNERSNGRVEITIFPNSQLGTNPEVFEQVRAGAPIITVSDPGYLGDFVADFGVLGGPYLMDDPKDFSKIIDSDFYQKATQRLRQEADLELLALNWLFGSRNVISNKPISSPADMASVTVRVPPNIMWVNTFEAMGARPVQLPWSEVYAGLSSGVVDAAEAPLPSLYGAKLYEPAKVISMTRHFIGFTGLIINANYFAGLPQDIQTILSEEAIAAGVYMTDLITNSEAEWMAKLEAGGVTFNKDIDIAAFREATASVYQDFPKWTPGLYQEIRSILDN